MKTQMPMDLVESHPTFYILISESPRLFFIIFLSVIEKEN